MNVFIGVGIIEDVQAKGRALKFNLALQQDKPCTIPCLIFDPDNEVMDLIKHLNTTDKTVWLQGKMLSSEYEYDGKTFIKLQLMVYPRNIKPL